MLRQLVGGMVAVLVIIGGWGAGRLPAAEAAAPRKVAAVEGITEYRLDNGLRVLLYPDASRPKVTVNLTVFVGSRHEGYGETGMAHLLEHMLFKGTPTHPDIPKVFKERGAQFNGSTWVDRTNYFETLPASDENLEFAIRLEADRMINSYVRREDLATEMTVVRNEFEQGENSPQEILGQRMIAVAYEWHNYGKSTIGNRTDIERVPIENLQAFYRKFYQPNNALLIIAGKFDEKKALDYVSKHFGPIPKGNQPLQSTYTEEPAQDGERVVTLRRVGDVGLVGVVYHVPSGSHPEFAAVQILASILDAEPSGRLYKALVETKKAASVEASAFAWHDPGVLQIMAEVTQGTSLEEVRDAILKVVEGLKDEGVTDEEVERARQKLLKDRELAADDPNRVAIQLSDWAAQGDWRLYFLDRDRLEKVTPRDVRAVAERYLTRSNRTVGIFVPTDKSQRAAIPETPDVAAMVERYQGRSVGSTGESFDATPAGIEARVHRPEPIEGVKVAFLPKKTRGESVHLLLTLRYGNAENLKGLTEAASLLPELMTRGTRKLTRQQIQDELDRHRARLSVGAMGGGGRGLRGLVPSVGTLTLTVETKRQSLAPVLEIVRQILREPTLPEKEFDILKNERLTDLEQMRQDPMMLAMLQLPRALTRYPRDDVRYSPTIDERIGRIKEATHDQVKTLYRDYLGAGHGELVVVGDFDPSEVRPIVEKALASWTAKRPYARIETPYQPDLPAGREAIETPDKANAVYVGGMTLPMKDDDPDYPALVAGNFVLGGGILSSRLGERLRTKGGLSYGAGSMFLAGDLDNLANLIIFAICNPANLPKVETGVAEELARLVKDGVTPRELEEAKKGYLQQQYVQRTNDQMIALKLDKYLHDGRTLAFEGELERKIEGLTPEAVAEALRKHFRPKRLAVIVAGDLKEGRGKPADSAPRGER